MNDKLTCPISHSNSYATGEGGQLLLIPIYGNPKVYRVQSIRPCARDPINHATFTWIITSCRTQGQCPSMCVTAWHP